MNKKYDVFLICPVRNANNEQKERMENYILDLENSGKTVYYPARDTDQIDSIGFRICEDNKSAISNAEEIHLFWDSSSSGSLFDLGVAFALGKKLTIVNEEEVEMTLGKSFANMITYWSREKITR